jgi:hypothetical protein
MAGLDKTRRTQPERTDMKISDAFPSNYLKATDLQDRNVIVSINYVKMDKIGEDDKPVLFFVGKEKGMVLNKTNANNIAAIYGDDTQAWRDKEIVLFPAMVDFQGKTVEAIRVRAPQPKDRPRKPDPITTGRPETELTDDEVPF